MVVIVAELFQGLVLSYHGAGVSAHCTCRHLSLFHPRKKEAQLFLVASLAVAYYSIPLYPEKEFLVYDHALRLFDYYGRRSFF